MPTYKKWVYPRCYKNPFFTGYYFGIVEIRIWNKPPFK